MGQYVRKINLQNPKFRGAKDLDHLAEMIEDHFSKVTRSLHDEFTNVERAGGISQKQTSNAIVNASSSSGGGGTPITITDYFRSGTIAVTSAGVPVLFSSDLGMVPSSFQFRCYNAAGDTIGCAITSLSSTGFMATSLEDATLEYVASKTI